jgi:hypothetical protein
MNCRWEAGIQLVGERMAPLLLRLVWYLFEACWTSDLRHQHRPPLFEVCWTSMALVRAAGRRLYPLPRVRRPPQSNRITGRTLQTMCNIGACPTHRHAQPHLVQELLLGPIQSLPTNLLGTCQAIPEDLSCQNEIHKRERNRR